MALILACVEPAAHAQIPVQVQPEPLFSNAGNAAATYASTLAGAWTLTQAVRDTCNPASCLNGIYLTNLRPLTTGSLAIVQNGQWYEHEFDMVSCGTPAGGSTTCTTNPNAGSIQLGWLCPNGQGGPNGQQIGSNPNTYVMYCPENLPEPPKTCPSCQAGDPIYTANGEESFTETDYSAAVRGLSFTRTYRSDRMGGFTSSVTAGFVDYSQPYGTAITACYLSYYAWPNGNKFPYCFPYIAMESQSYQVATPEGNFIQFSGPNNAVTQKADINDRVAQINVGGVNEWQTTRENGNVETYSGAGSLLQKTLRGGRTITYTYSTSSTPSNIAPWPGLLIAESDPFGHTLSWQYNATGQMTQMTDPAGGVYKYNYDGNGNMTRVSYPDGTSRGYLYNEQAYTGNNNFPNALTGVVDESGTRYATITYAHYGYPVGPSVAVGSQHAGVDNYSVSYTSVTHSANVTDPLGTQRTYSFTQNLSYLETTSISQPAASDSGTVTESWSYDANDNVNQFTDFNGSITKYSYDETRNLETSRIEAYGTAQARTITTQWDPSWREPDLITEPGRTTAYTYDSMGNVLTKTITDTATNASRTWAYTYDSYGRMLTAEDPKENFVHYAYYTCTSGGQCGELQTVTDALGHETTYNTYDGNGRPLTITDPNGTVTTLTYDLRGRLTSRTVAGETTSISYYPTGLIEQVSLPDGSSISYGYDAAHRLTQVSDGLGNKIVYTLDPMGNRIAENTYDPSSTLHRTHTRVINALNEIYREINAAGTAAVTTTLGYDNDGNRTSSDAPLSRNTGETYDALNRVSSITDPANGITRFGYDAEDDLTSVKDPRSLTTSYGYDGFGDLTSQSSPDTGNTTNTYDPDGNLATSTDARGTVATYGYDALNRVTSIAYSLGGTTDQTLSFTYDQGTDGIGHLTGASDANHSMSFSYDALGELTGTGQTVGGVSRSVGYIYTNGDLTSLTTPSGQTVTYGYNANHQITSIAVNGTTVLSSVSYEPFGPVDGWTWGNGNAFTRTFDGDGDITGISTTGTQESLSYDNASRISGITNTAPGSSSWTYGYDPLDRLTGATSSPVTEGWTYDADGNRTSETGTSPSTYSISATGNQITGITGALTRTYAYDAAGNTLGDTTDRDTYNDAGRLRTISNASGTTTFLYNAFGQMSEASGPSGIILYAYDQAGHLLGEYDGSGNLIQETVWLGDIPVATLRPSGSSVAIYYVVTDQLGAPREIVRPSDYALMWTWFSGPFGVEAPNEIPQGIGTFVSDLRLPGQIAGSWGSTYQNNQRDFDPASGRYMESDPVGLRAGVNTYAYVLNSPLSLVDPLGLRPLTQCEKDLLRPYIPQIDLDDADLHDGQVPWYLGQDFEGITRGNDIYFRPGVYDSTTPAGIAVLGHELVHVGQYRGGMNWLEYLWSTRHGYANSKYEIPAYAMQSRIEQDLEKAHSKGCPACKK